MVNILLVEDEALIAIFMEMELKKMGFAVCNRVETGEAALLNVKQKKPDLILLDIRLAGSMDGIETARKINDIDNIPIIFMTGYPDENIKQRVRELHPVEYFVKPVNIKKLKTTIDAIFV